MAEDFVPSDDRPDQTQFRKERVKHLLVGSPKTVKRTIETLHVQGYAEASFWSKPVAANELGESGEVISVLLRFITIE